MLLSKQREERTEVDQSCGCQEHADKCLFLYASTAAGSFDSEESFIDKLVIGSEPTG